MSNSNSIYDKIKHLSWLLAVPLMLGVFITSCGDTPVDSETDFVDSSRVNNDINFVPDQFDAVGTIQGTVIDKATGEALSNVAVSLNFMPADAEEPSILTDSTGSEGTFSFTGVPVNSEYNNNAGSEHDNSPYTLKISAEEHDNYRDLYRMNTVLTFDGTGGDGAATNLVSDVTIPLSEQAVTLTGKAQTSADANLSGVKVMLYQRFNPIINGSSGTQTEMLVDSSETGEDGSFEFTGVEEGEFVRLQFKDDSDPSDVINHETSWYEMPAADGGTPEKALGDISVSSSDESGAFYLTSVTPEPNSDISSTDTSFVYTFNRPVAKNSWTDASRGFGSGTFKDEIEFTDNGMKKSPGDLEFSVSWSEDRTELTITPEGLQDATEYMLDVADAIDHDKFVDEHENTLTYGASDYSSGEVEELAFSIGVNNDSPHSPEISHNAEEGGTVDYNDGSLTASWEVDESSADVKKYEVWVKKGDQAYEHLRDINRDDITFGEAETGIAPTYNRPLVETRDNVPDEAITHSFKVRAISKNLVEGEFSNEITFADSTQPNVMSSAEFQENTNYVFVEFSEPMVKSQVEDPSNYTFNNATVEEVLYYPSYGNNPGNESYQAAIVLENVGSLSDGETLELAGNMTDLAGNELDNNEVTLQQTTPSAPQLSIDTENYDVDWRSGSLDMSWDVNNDPVEVDRYEITVTRSNGDEYTIDIFDTNNVNPDNAFWGELDYTFEGRDESATDDFGGQPDWLDAQNFSAELLILDRSNPPADATYSYEVQVRAFGVNGETAVSDPITVEDVTQPQVASAYYNGADEITVSYNEPMDESAAETPENYSFSDSNITIDTIEADVTSGVATITVENGSNVSGGQSVTVENVSDLSGNSIDTDNNSATY